jgi:glycosyltransferase 2 family protein
MGRPLVPALEPESEKGTPSVWNLLLAVALSAIVLGIVLWKTYEPETVALIRGMNLVVLGLAIGLVGVRILLGGLRLTYIAHGNLTLVGGLRGAIAWDFMSAVTPSSFGGAPLAAYFVARDNRLPVGEATAMMIFSMLADQVWFAVSIPLVLLAALHFDIFPEALGDVGAVVLVLFLVVIMLWAVLFAYATIIRPGIVEMVTTRLLRMRIFRRLEARARRGMVSMRQRNRVLRGQPVRFYVIIFLLTAGLWLARYGTLVVVIVAIYPHLDVVTGFLRAAAMLLAGLIVPTPGGSGGVEGLYVLFLGPLIPAAAVGPSLLVWRLISYHFFIGAGLAVLVQHFSRRRKGLAGKPLRQRRMRRAE